MVGGTAEGDILKQAQSEKVEMERRLQIGLQKEYEMKLEKRSKEEGRKRMIEMGIAKEETRKLTQKMADDQKLLEECRTQLSRQHHALMD